jgi:dTDP-D-glucose 4,6-dehydratase
VTEDSFVSIDRAKTRLGWRPRFSNKDALVRNYRWYLANADRLGGAGVTHRVPWKQGALALAKLVFRAHA